MFIHSLTLVTYILLIRAEDDITNLLKKLGYRAEVHSITTQDSYILNIHRIPPSKATSKVVIFMHGMLGYSGQFLITGAGLQKALAFKLADNGYDVWLGNARGNEFSKNHTNLLPTSEKFWKFSLDEIAKYDVPAIIDYILTATNNTSTHYVGHSQGTTLVMAMLSRLPQYNKKLKTVHLMAPSIYFKNALLHLKTAAMFSEPVEEALTAAGIVEIPSTPPQSQKLVAYICSSKPLIEFCKRMWYFTNGPSEHINEAIFTSTALTNVLPLLSSSGSVMQLMHYVQLARSGGDKFLQYDYKENNYLMYNQSTPPEYHLSNVKTKIHFLYGSTDYTTNYQDVERIIAQLKPWTIAITKLSGYNHFDFFLAKNIDQFVNTKVLDLMNRYNN